MIDKKVKVKRYGRYIDDSFLLKLVDLKPKDMQGIWIVSTLLQSIDFILGWLIKFEFNLQEETVYIAVLNTKY